MQVSIIIPVLNEEKSIGKVLQNIPDRELYQVIVVDNGSIDKTVEVAKDYGANVVFEPKRGYGSACLRGISEVHHNTDIIVFLDGDYSFHSEELPELLLPFQNNSVDFVIGTRIKEKCQPGSFTIQQRFGNLFATKLLKYFYGISTSDLGPFRAIKYKALKQLEMQDRDFGWNIEMQIKAHLIGLTVVEVPVSYRPRFAGSSKISGNIIGSIKAGYKILFTIMKFLFK